MTFFQRFKTPFAEGHDDEQARMQPRMRMIGEHLQERREDLGLDLDEIGAMLRIKPSYLAALEQGRTQDLPGPTYAIGFVRAYAEFLGLDAEPVLARFKAEASGVTARPDLALPVPLGERSLPGGALVLVALILALCGYGIWYYLSTDDRSRPERVAAVPASLKPPTQAPVLVAPPTAQPDSSGAAPAATAAPSATPQTSAPASPAAAAKTGDGQTPPAPNLFGAATGGAPSNPAPPLATASAPSASLPSAPTLAPGTLLTTMPRADAPPPRPAPVPASPAVATPASPPPTAQLQGTQTAATQPQSTAAGAPANNGASAAGAGRVAIRALSDCWIQVRATDQTIVFSRVLKSGEVYNVPSRSGLSLRTGNAGALQIDVDGKPVPSIGSIGALRRDVSLDPAELTAGTAVHG